MSRRGWALFLVMCVIWGVPYLLIKVAVDEMSAASLVLVRTGLGAALLLPVAAAKGLLRPLVRKWRPLLVYTVVGWLEVPVNYEAMEGRWLVTTLPLLVLALGRNEPGPLTAARPPRRRRRRRR